MRVGGIGAENQDFVNAIYGSFPVMIALIAVLTFLLLARAFRSLLLPLKAVLLNVISVAAAWGVITLVWQEGHGSNILWGIAATHRAHRTAGDQRRPDPVPGGPQPGELLALRRRTWRAPARLKLRTRLLRGLKGGRARPGGAASPSEVWLRLRAVSRT